MQQLETPVIIVGAGPAGVATSIYLSLAGIAHIIIDKETFPRDKVCGDGISGKSAHVLRKANPAWLHEVYQQPDKFMPSSGIIFYAPNGKALNIPFGDNLIPGELAPGFTSSRLVFDNFLFQKIDKRYATVYQSASIKNIERNDDKINVIFTHGENTYSISAPVIVAADGDKSIVRKTFRNDESSPKSYSVGLRAYYKNVSGLDSKNYIELHFFTGSIAGLFLDLSITQWHGQRWHRPNL